MDSSRMFSIAGRFAIATLLWAGLTVPNTFTATAQDSTPMVTPEAATPMTGAQAATPMAAQQATPIATPALVALDVPLIDVSGDAVGLATFTENADGVTVRLLIEGLTPGEHGWHLHEFGVCEPGRRENTGTRPPSRMPDRMTKSITSGTSATSWSPRTAWPKARSPRPISLLKPV